MKEGFGKYDRKERKEIFQLKKILLVELRWAQKQISMNPYDNLESEQAKIEKDKFSY